MDTLFIHTNRKQLLGAKLAKYSFEKEAGPGRTFDAKLIIAEELPEMRAFVGTTFPSGGRLRTYTFDDLQSFTMTRFKPPELMGYQGRAIVIDPDIFALPGTNLGELFSLDLEGYALAACRREHKNKWESSVMLMDCSKLRHWNLKEMLARLGRKELDQSSFMWLEGEDIKQIPWKWNSMDTAGGDAKILHTTNRLTQPWKTGLRIDFTQKPLPKIAGIIPREPIYKLIGKYPTHYLPHPDKKIVDFFFMLVKNALKDGALTEAEILSEVAQKHVRSDIVERLKEY